MDGINRSRGWDKEIRRGILPMEQLVLGDKWAKKILIWVETWPETILVHITSGAVVKSIIV